ncbi:hypothetical protein TthTF19_14270 [Thermus thermophilus]|uniref:hypothetical protein n=1 Tax=Thermus thermophilus TaxID=274 RepID=UPI0030DE3C0A
MEGTPKARKVWIEAHPLAPDGPEVVVLTEGEGPAWPLEGLRKAGVRGVKPLGGGRLAFLLENRRRAGLVVLALAAAALRQGLEVEAGPLAREEARVKLPEERP